MTIIKKRITNVTIKLIPSVDNPDSTLEEAVGDTVPET